MTTPMQPPRELPKVDETTGRGKRIRETEDRFGMTCIDTMGKQADFVPDTKPYTGEEVGMDDFTKQFANGGAD